MSIQCLLQILSCILLIDYIHAGLHEKRLLKYLFDQSRPDAHNPIERPSEIDTGPLGVSVKFFLNQVMDVHEKDQVITTILWIDLSWNDYHFKWDPQEYGNVSVINLPYTAVWRPDILLYNCADEKFDRTFPTNTIIKHTGEVQWMPPGLFKSTCNIDILWFPFDEQNCLLKFGSWTYYGDQIDFRLACINQTQPNCTEIGPVDLSEYSPNGEFHLMSAHVKRFAQRYECCDYDFIDIKLYIRLQRRALYYVFNLIVPCLLISGMSLMVFMLPPDAGEKISLGVTILLSLTMFLQLVADKLPQTSEAIPLIGIYFCCTMIMCSLSIVFTVLVLNYHHRSADIVAVPSYITKVVNNYMARLMFMESPKRNPVIVEGDNISLQSEHKLIREEVEKAEPGIHLIGKTQIVSNWNKDMKHSADESEKIGDQRIVDQPKWIETMYRGKSPDKNSTPFSRLNRINGLVRMTKNLSVDTQVQNKPKLMHSEKSSRSLLANVLDLEDDFRATVLTSPAPSQVTRPNSVSTRRTNKPHHSPRTPLEDIDIPPKYDSPSMNFYKHLYPGRTTSIYKSHDDQMPDILSPDNLSDFSSNKGEEDTTSRINQSIPKQFSMDDPVSVALLSTYRNDLEQILTELRFITKKIRDDEHEALVNLEWKFAARVIDRFCLIIFSIFNILAAVGILFSAPNLVESFQT